MPAPGLAAAVSEFAHGRRRVSSGAALLVDERARAILRALADRPRQPYELEQLSGVARSTLYTRLGELTSVGIVEMERISEFPLRVAYGLTGPGRHALAAEMIAERMRRTNVAWEITAESGSLGDLVRVLAPITRLGRGVEGGCLLIESDPDTLDRVGRGGAVGVVAREGAVAARRTTRAPAATVRGAPQAWNGALLTSGRKGLEFAGEQALGAAVVRSLRATLSS